MRRGLDHSAIEGRRPDPHHVALTLLAGAGTVLLAAFVIICVRTRSAWPWNLVVHEDGQRTLILTILYFEHAARELPLDLLLGVAIGGSVFWAFPTSEGTGNWRGADQAATLAWTTAIVIAVIVAGTLFEGGVPMVLDNVFQNHTRPGAPLSWGSHWRYHLLERLALILVSIGFAGLWRLFARGEGARGLPGLVAAAASVGVYLALTIVFSRGLPSLLQPFRDPQYLGHQARELLTHALVTVPVGWGFCLLTLPDPALTAPTSRPSPERSGTPIIAVAIAAGALGVVLAGYVGVAALMTDAASHGQTKDLIMLIFPHFFEHSFTYLLVPVVAGLTYTLAARRA
jgi:hypothetical protein